MSSNKISVDPQAVYDILRQVKRLVESTHSSISAVNTRITNAEIGGHWNDKSFYVVKEDYEIAQRQLKEGLKHIETTIIPHLNKTIKAIENFR